MERELSRRERAAERRHWMLAAMLIGVATAVWCMLIAPFEITGSIPVPEAVRVSYRPVLLQGEELGDNLQAVWSPVLFSLPTHVGFSREMLSSSRVMLPPVDLPEDLFLMTSAPPVLVRGLKKAGAATLQAGKIIAQRRKQGEDSSDRSVFADEVVEPSGSQVYIRYGQGFSDDAFLTNPVRAVSSDAVQDGVFHITLAPAGYVESVFVEKSSGNTEWDAGVVRELYTWRAVPDARKRDGYIMISAGRHVPPGGREEAAP